MVAATIHVHAGTGVVPPMNTYTVDAKVDIMGQCSSLVSHVEYGAELASSVVFDLQKRHTYARFTMNICSDQRGPCELIVHITTPGKMPSSHHIKLGMEGLLSWQYSANLHESISCNTVWEISVPTGVYSKTCKILTLSLRPCEDNAQELLGEGFRFGAYDDEPDEPHAPRSSDAPGGARMRGPVL
jgi:hypothetical protein